jgi:hypothetical protein
MMADYLIAAGLFCAVAALVIIWLDLRRFLSGKGPPQLPAPRPTARGSIFQVWSCRRKR